MKEEYLVYDLGSLAGDVGGVIGILLGTSVLALYDALRGCVGLTFSLKPRLLAATKECFQC